MKQRLGRVAYVLLLAVWAIGIPIAFSSRPLWGILWSAVGAFYFSLDIVIRRTESVVFAGISRLGTSVLLFGVGVWRLGWDDVIIFPLATFQLALAVTLMWLGVRER